MYWKYNCLKRNKMSYGAQFILDTNDRKHVNSYKEFEVLELYSGYRIVHVLIVKWSPFVL